MGWFYSAPLALVLPLFLIVYVALSLGIVVAIRPWVRRAAGEPKEWDRVVGYTIGTFGVFFGIFLALVSVAVYQNYAEVHANAAAEASALGTLYRDVSGFPPSVAAPMQDALRDYAHSVIAHDWPLQAAGRSPAESYASLNRFQHLLLSFDPKTEGDKTLLSPTVSEFNALVDARRLRISATSLGLPPLLWVLIWVGAAINAVLLACVDVKNLRVHLLMSGLLALFVALVIFVTADMDHPYMGAISVDSGDFVRVLDQVMTN